MEKWNRLKFSEVVLNFFLDYYLLNFRECDYPIGIRREIEHF